MRIDPETSFGEGGGSGTEARFGRVVKDGTYEAVVHYNEDAYSKAGNPMHVVTFIVDAGAATPEGPAKVSYYGVEGQFSLGTLVKVLAPEIHQHGGELSPGYLKGRRARVTIRNKPDQNGEARANVTKLAPMETSATSAPAPAPATASDGPFGLPASDDVPF